MIKTASHATCFTQINTVFSTGGYQLYLLPVLPLISAEKCGNANSKCSELMVWWAF